MNGFGATKAAPAVPACAASHVTGLADALLGEIADLLDTLANTGEPGAIDLRSLPMTDADRALLKDRLGAGEVHATLDVAGPSSVEETAIPGVWWVRHEGAGGMIANEHIEVTLMPQILMTQPDDLAAGRERLADLMAENEKQVPAEKTANETS